QLHQTAGTLGRYRVDAAGRLLLDDAIDQSDKARRALVPDLAEAVDTTLPGAAQRLQQAAGGTLRQFRRARSGGGRVHVHHAVASTGQLLDQHAGDTGLLAPGQGLGQHFVVEVAHGVHLAAAHRVAFGEHVAGLAHLLEDLLQEQGLELLGRSLQLLLAGCADAVGATAVAVHVLGEGNDAHGSDHDQFGIEGTGLLQRLEDAHDIVRGGAEAVHGVDDAVQAGPFGPLEPGVLGLAYGHVGARHHGGLATGEGVGLADLRVLADGHGQGAVSHGCGLDAHALANHHGAGTAVEHHLRSLTTFFHLKPLQHGHKADALGAGDWRANGDLGRVQRAGGAAAETAVDRLDYPCSGLEARLT